MRTGDRVRVRFGNLSMDSHPIHLHGHRFHVTGTDAGTIPPAARYLHSTIDVPVGTTRDIELVADNPGDWPLHCHKSHHTMNAMSHDLPNMIGVDARRRGGEDPQGAARLHGDGPERDGRDDGHGAPAQHSCR